MRSYKVKVKRADRVDMLELRIFLLGVLSFEGAERYLTAMRAEIQSLCIYADLFQRSSSKQILSIHPAARRMPSHNKKWLYIFHTEGDYVIVDRILQAKKIIH